MFSLNIAKSKALEVGIDVYRLRAGTIVLATTKHNLYKLIKMEDRTNVYVQGGKFFPEPTEAVFTGSTFGGSMIKLGWIGYGMYMEMYVVGLRKRIKTSPVNAAKIIGNGWEYDMDWENIKIAKIEGA